MFKEIFTEAQILVRGSSPAGAWTAKISSNGEVTGGKDPWNQPMTTKWFKELAYKGKEKDFLKSILKKDLEGANDNSHVTITEIG
jgi:hypothetical protein